MRKNRAAYELGKLVGGAMQEPWYTWALNIVISCPSISVKQQVSGGGVSEWLKSRVEALYAATFLPRGVRKGEAS